MIKRITSILFSLILILISTTSYASGFFSNLNIQEVEKIFEDADKSNLTVFLDNKSPKAIPAVQILPETNSPKYSINSGTQCIKLYSCNQGICLVGINSKKYATNEVLLNKLTQKASNSCQLNIATTTTEKTKKTLATTVKSKATKKTAKPIPFSWVKVIQVKKNDSLNIRKTTNYKSKKMGTLAFNANCIKRFSCTGKWCKIQQQNNTGWVHRKFITKMGQSEQAQCS